VSSAGENDARDKKGNEDEDVEIFSEVEEEPSLSHDAIANAAVNAHSESGDDDTSDSDDRMEVDPEESSMTQQQPGASDPSSAQLSRSSQAAGQSTAKSLKDMFAPREEEGNEASLESCSSFIRV
jgi:hypothetical protein